MNCKSGHLIFISIMIVFSACTNGPKEQPVNDSSSNWALLNFEKIDSSNPVLVPGTNEFIDPISKKSIAWEAKDVFNPAIVVKNDSIFMLYRAQDKIGLPGGTSRIGLATSLDGLHFTKLSAPVFYPDNDSVKKLYLNPE